MSARPHDDHPGEDPRDRDDAAGGSGPDTPPPDRPGDGDAPDDAGGTPGGGDTPDDAFDDDLGDDGFDEDLDDDSFDELEPLGLHEAELVAQDLADLADFEATFRAEGFRGVSVWCQDCVEEHYYPWDMLRENLELLLQTGETPVHEPAYAPEPERYVGWDYARGYIDALRDAGVDRRRDVDHCTRCGLELTGSLRQANFCARCGTPLLAQRLRAALAARGNGEDAIDEVLRESGLAG